MATACRLSRPIIALLGLLVLLHGIPPLYADSTQTGVASYYHNRFHGRRTASGEPYRKHEYTAAHRRLPLGSRVRVTNLSNDRSVEVRINDRGPYSRRRIIDLSYQAASELDFLKKGLTEVKVEVLALGG